MECPSCGHLLAQRAKFCDQCGKPLVEQKTDTSSLYISYPKTRSLFEIIFEPIRAEFNSREEAQKSSKTADWNGTSIPVSEVRHIRSVVNRNQYPFICAKCKEHVAKVNKGRCRHCEGTEWITRTI